MIRSAYLSKPIFMPDNRRFVDYVQSFAPSSIVYKSGILKNNEALSFLGLTNGLTDALDWLVDNLSTASLPIINRVVVTSSTISLSPQETIDFWTVLTASITLSESAELYFLGGKGCNCMVYGCLQSIKDVQSGFLDNILVINIDLFLEQSNRYSDYAFFSDNVAFVCISNEELDYICEGYDTTLAQYPADAFATSCSFFSNAPALSFYQKDEVDFFTLNTFYFLLAKKYQARPSQLAWNLDTHLSVHRYSFDPFFNLIMSDSKRSVLHVESPPFHCEELRLSRVD